MEGVSPVMSERERVIEAVTALFVATDRREWDAVRSCFSDNVLFDMSSLGGSPSATVPAETIVSGWKTGLAALKAIHHQVGNFQVRIAGDDADVSCYGIAYHYLPNGTGRNMRIFVGSYELHLLRTGAGWKIEMLRYFSKFVEGNPDLEHS
ncbi:MAG TPA: nuclear transport factor 2 family protein [Methanoregula sp.]|nr:nuclear transport factor 2 family protein [Methanoregula sp.]